MGIHKINASLYCFSESIFPGDVFSRLANSQRAITLAGPITKIPISAKTMTVRKSTT